MCRGVPFKGALAIVSQQNEYKKYGLKKSVIKCQMSKSLFKVTPNDLVRCSLIIENDLMPSKTFNVFLIKTSASYIT